MTKDNKVSNKYSLRDIIINSLEDSKAENILTIDLANKANFAKYIVIASGMADKHVNSIADRLSRDLKDNGIFDIHIEGKKESSWILIDAGDIVVNIFKPEIREFYNLEKMWNIEFAQ